jgi:rhamnose transport system ATP-binding protein
LAVLATGYGLVRFLEQPKTDPNRLLLYGNVDLRQVELAFNNSERIAEVLVQEGDRVTRGRRDAGILARDNSAAGCSRGGTYLSSGSKATESPLFALKGVGKRYGAAFACRGVSFDIFAGDVIGLAGENGAGKSTTMKCLAGWIEPTEGNLESNGKRIDFVGPRDGELAGIAVIPQELDLFPELTVYENIFAGLDWPRNRFGAFDRAGMKAESRRILEMLGADFDVGSPVKVRPPADQKLVQIARALNRRARLLIMDEPTAALTKVESDRLFKFIHDLQNHGAATIHVTHRLDEIFDHCNRVVVLRDGQMTGAGDIGDFDIASLIKAMVGRSVEQFYVRKFHGAPGQPLLEAKGLSRGKVYQNIDLTLHAGEVLGVAGLIGAGRTEIAHSIAGIRPADSGEIRVRGKPVKLHSMAAAMRHGIAYLPEERRSQGLHLPFSVSWNMTFGALSKVTRYGFVDERKEYALAKAAAKAFSVKAASLDMPVGSLSGGNQQKVLLGKVLADDPDVIILDEPTRGVDVGAKAEIYVLIEAMARAGKAVMLISSEIEEVISLSDRIITVYNGHINRLLKREEFLADAVGYAISGQAANG